MGSIRLFLAVIFGSAVLLFSASAAPSFVIEKDTFLVDGKPIQLMSGSFHYSRCKAELWEDRLRRMRAMGLNAIQTYVPWNFHEQTKGNFNWQGDRDLAKFIETAGKVGLLVLVRMGPYMCGEWEFGGFPAYLINEAPIKIRTYDANYIKYVDLYMKGQLLPLLKPLLYSNGGPVVMVQVENEYGSYGNVQTHPTDLKYMQHLVAITNEVLGKDSVIIYTTDGGNTGYMSRGSLKGSAVYTVGDHGPGSDASNCKAMKEFNDPGKCPCMDSEYYTGWLTHWGEHMANTSSANVAKWTDALLASGGSINLYMGYGGSNFGVWAGANGGGKNYQPHITSYDYDSPVSEGGEHGWGSDKADKYKALQKVFKRHANGTVPPEPPLLPRTGYPQITLGDSAGVFANIDILTGSKTALDAPVNVEALGQAYGLTLYTYTPGLPSGAAGKSLSVGDYPRDRAQVFVAGALAGTVYRPQAQPVTIPSHGSKGEELKILVELMGRLNYGGGMFDPKGIVNDVKLGSATLAGSKAWSIRTIPLNYKQLSQLAWKKSTSNSTIDDDAFSPTFYRGQLVLSNDPVDTYIKPSGWTKGMIWVNGFNLGRYWESKGPSHTLYLPSPVLKKGNNEIIMLEMDKPNPSAVVHFSDTPDFSGAAPVQCKTAAPKAGDVLQMFALDSGKAKNQMWTSSSVGQFILKSTAEDGTSLCLQLGPKTDTTYHFPLAQLAVCDTTKAEQQFQYKKSGMTTIVNKKTGKCLDVSNHDKDEGAFVGFYNCASGSANQQWTVQDTPSHGLQITVEETKKSLTGC